MKSVSVAMATYNGAKYLQEQLDSIIFQSYYIDEIIIVDDYSSDETWNILTAYRENYNNIQIFRNSENLGVARTFECALNLCSGDFIALADQDDYWLPNKIEVLLSKIGNNSLIHSDAKIVNERLEVTSHHFKKESKSFKYDRWFDYLMQNNVTGCTTMFRRHLLNKALPFPKNIILHDSYIAMVAFNNGGITYCHTPLILYRQHAANVHGATSSVSYDKFSIVAYKKYKFAREIEERICVSDRRVLLTIADYYYCIHFVKIPPIQVLVWVLKNLSFKNFLGLLCLTCFNKKIAELLYNKFC